jgi:hypothetical protein
VRSWTGSACLTPPVSHVRAGLGIAIRTRVSFGNHG